LNLYSKLPVNNKVYIVKCDSYDAAEEKMAELFRLMGGVEKFAFRNEKIVLKVNILRGAKPDKAVSTHPAVVSAVARLLNKAGNESIAADSPGSGYKYNKITLEKTYQTCGLVEASKESGFELNLDCTYQEVSFTEGKLIKRFEVITPILQNKGVFNLCKMKTHVFMVMTGAVKNNFGVIPGLTKPGYHAKLHDTQHFADMLLDLAEFVSPRLSIMDAIVAMEGDGPGLGTPRKVGLLLGSTNQLALDIVAAEIMGITREQNPVLLAAEKRGMIPNDIKDVEVVGEDLSHIRIRDFKLPSNIYGGAGLGSMPWYQSALKVLFKDAFSSKPVIVKDTCKACGACVKACPVKAVAIKKQKHAAIEEKKCIRCYCCHEMCPENAVQLKNSILYRLVNG
jgi:uncharacterized protein (DUF362 family)/NAD-dependent dihydropyrimidine dehydrogenase PreA subunit